MDASGVPLVCEAIADWHALLPRVIADEDLRHSAGTAGRGLAETVYSRDRMLGAWDEVLRSVVGPS
jgi:hypothetical protein